MRSIAEVVAGRWPSPLTSTGLRCCQHLPPRLRFGARTEVRAALHGLGHRTCGTGRVSPRHPCGCCADARRVLFPLHRAAFTDEPLRHAGVHSRHTRECAFEDPMPPGPAFRPRGFSPPRRLAPPALCGLVASRCRPGVRRVSPAEADSPRRCGPSEVSRVDSRFSVTRRPGLRSHRRFTRARCLLGVSSPPPASHRAGPRPCPSRPPNRSAVAHPLARWDAFQEAAPEGARTRRYASAGSAPEGPRPTPARILGPSRPRARRTPLESGARRVPEP